MMTDLDNLNPAVLKKAIEYDSAVERHKEQLFETKRNALLAVVASTLALFATVLFGFIDYSGDKKWNQEQITLLQSIEQHLEISNELRAVSNGQADLNKRIDRLREDIDSLSK